MLSGVRSKLDEIPLLLDERPKNESSSSDATSPVNDSASFDKVSLSDESPLSEAPSAIVFRAIELVIPVVESGCHGLGPLRCSICRRASSLI